MDYRFVQHGGRVVADAFYAGAELRGLDGATAGHFEGVPEDHVRVFDGDGGGGCVVEVEAAEAQSSSEWYLSRRICLASAMRVD